VHERKRVADVVLLPLDLREILEHVLHGEVEARQALLVAEERAHEVVHARLVVARNAEHQIDDPEPRGHGHAHLPPEPRRSHSTVEGVMRSVCAWTALAVAALAFGNARADGPWTDRLIDGVPEFAASDSSLQLDLQGRPHVFVGGDRVYHYWLDGGAWQSEVV